MIDKIVVINDAEALIIFTNQPPKRLTSPDVRFFVQWFLRNDTTLTYGEFKAAINNQGDTAIIDLKEVA